MTVRIISKFGYQITTVFLALSLILVSMASPANAAPQHQAYIWDTAIVNMMGLCLDVNASEIQSNGGRVQVWTCNGEPQQQWRFDENQRLINAAGKCLDAVLFNNGIERGTIQVWDCDPARLANQQWTYVNNQLVSPLSLSRKPSDPEQIDLRTCLTSQTPFWYQNGGLVELRRCSEGGLHQQWAVFNGPGMSSSVLKNTTEGCSKTNAVTLRALKQNIEIYDWDYGAYLVRFQPDGDGNSKVYWHCAGSKDDYTECPQETNAVDVTRPVPELGSSRKFAVTCLLISGYLAQPQPISPHRDLPTGSWRDSCVVQDAYIDQNDFLRASCYLPDGSSRQTFIYQPSRCLTEPSNYEGHLFCTHGGFPAGSGSYQESCAEMTYAVNSAGQSMLTAQCRKIDGSWVAATLDAPQNCVSTIANDNGRLVCNYAPPPTATPWPTPRPTPQPTQVVLPFQTLQTADGACLSKGAQFEWQDNIGLPAGHLYEIVVWRAGEDPMRASRGITKADTRISRWIDLDYLDDQRDWFAPGDYYWGILEISPEPYQRHKVLGTGGWFRYVRGTPCAS